MNSTQRPSARINVFNHCSEVLELRRIANNPDLVRDCPRQLKSIRQQSPSCKLEKGLVLAHPCALPAGKDEPCNFLHFKMITVNRLCSVPCLETRTVRISLHQSNLPCGG